jgi:tetratricopeptide (TPR) repeat protein
MVLDNADDQEIFFDASAQTGQQGGQQRSIALVNYLPRSSSGSIIITTRNKQVGHRLANREMPTTIFPFQAEDARQLLRTKIPRDIDWSEEESMELLEILHYLPLAITQAAGYICEEQVTLGRYLGLLRDDLDAKDVLEQDYYDPARDSEIQNSILLTWKISFDQITRQKPRAAEILSLMAVLDRQSISDFLLIKKDDRKVTFDTAMGTLKAFSLITEERRGATFGMHRLVQISIQRWLEAQQALLKWQEIALNVVSQCSPSSTEYGSWSAWETISPHIQVVLGYDIGIEPSLAQRASILTNTASYDEQQGRYGSAGEKGREALTIRQKLFGIKHPDTLTSMNILASVLHNQGKYDEAEGMHRQVSELRKQLLGNEHPDTLTSMNDLANILKSQGKYEEAERLHRQELELREKVLGKEHPHTLISMNNLALVLKSQGKYEEAERLNQHVLELTKEILGKEHPRTLISMNNLASVLQNQGKNEEAERLHRHVLELRKEVLGNEHPHTLTSMNNLASVLQNQGKNEEAERLHRQVLELRKEVSENEHPHTLISMNNLASVLKSQGKYENAEEIHRQELKLSKTVLGKEHPSTRKCMNNLVSVLKYMGKYEEAERVHQQV